jgi:hypothetical protein
MSFIQRFWYMSFILDHFQTFSFPTFPFYRYLLVIPKHILLIVSSFSSSNISLNISINRSPKKPFVMLFYFIAFRTGSFRICSTFWCKYTSNSNNRS